MAETLNVVGIVRAKETYFVIYPDDRRADALRHLGRWASDPGLSFTWYDAALLSQRVRELAKEPTRG